MVTASRSAFAALRHCLLLGWLAVATSACAGNAPPASANDDGPYVFRADGKQLDAFWVCNGEVVHVRQRASKRLQARCGYAKSLAIPAQFAPGEAPLAPGARIVAISDIHGQYDITRQLLHANGVIDDKDRWSMGRDHLVVDGDTFDRGAHVTEALWLLFQLQQQARAAGGAVHVLLGNHETMALYGGLQYLNPKYKTVAEKLERDYPALYGADSVLGQWLRTRPALLKLGDTLFVHGGISPEDVDLVAGMGTTNAAYQRTLGLPRKTVEAGQFTARLYDHKRSPIWYRGYFNGDMDTAQVEALAQRLGVARIVVGHTTIGEVASFHEGRVIAIDSGIKRGKSGQLLFIDGDTLSRGLMDGTRQPLPSLQEVPDDPE